ncbi:RHS repeat-associated core domain-containing protein [Pseudomonas citrulli]|uniref:RHS repeat-associated core domain-containing protein n=1 Tax=Pseudomonas citrulli TaxID=3064347 RepID=A0ABT9C9B6_9PSED|nr:RHS repeat-associated core domain-containing protein [Pseudomonas sp. K18]MDO7899832.1 RHS repeat-associated core domain-containing protein [Pseudomonas sp. K18]
MSQTKILCRYQYDPLDRLTGLRPLESAGTQRFYQQDELVTEIEGQAQRSILRHEAQPLAQRTCVDNVTETTLLATDHAHSPLKALADTTSQQLAYTAYGHRSGDSGLSGLLGFNGELPDGITGHYLLGQGNRAFNPVLMRFNSPDELSPFGEGGINAYAYCGGDPVNWRDPSGNVRIFSIITPWNFVQQQPLHKPWEMQALDLSSKAISRTASRTHQGPTFSKAARLVPERSHKKLHRGTSAPTKKQSIGRKSIGQLKKQALEWDDYVERNRNTFIDADPKWHKLHDDALVRLEEAKKNPHIEKSSLDALASDVTRKRQRVKRNALANLEHWRWLTQGTPNDHVMNSSRQIRDPAGTR